mgnify:FL=1
MIAILVVVILLLMFVYYFFNKQKALTTGIRDAQKYYYVDSASLNLNESESTPEMGVSIWVYVSDWVQADGRDRIILYMGPDTATHASGSVVYGLKSNAKLSKSDTSYQDSDLVKGDDLLTKSTADDQTTFVLWFKENNPTLRLGIANDGTETFLDSDGDNISIKNFPLQKWVSITFSVYQNVLDLYLNGKLVKSVLGSTDSVIMSDNILVALGNPFNVDTLGDNETTVSNVTSGFKGYTSRLSYYNKSLSPKEAYNIYKNGPGTSYLGDILGDRGVNINFMDGEEVTNTFSL